MTETLFSIAYGLSCGSLAFYCFWVLLGSKNALWGVFYFLVLAVCSSLLGFFYVRYRNSEH